MSNRNIRRFDWTPRAGLVPAVLACLFLAVLPAGAEISVGGPGPAPSFLATGSGSGNANDPWPSWAPVRQNVDPVLVLNPDGDANGDGPAAWAIDPATGNPVVVWAWWDGNDHEIVLSRWTGSGWSSRDLLTDNDLDDVDPAVTITPGGGVRVSWWRSENGHHSVYYLDVGTREAGPEVVTPLPRAGSRPGIALSGGDVVVAFQREESGLRQVRAAWRSAGWDDEIVAETAYAGPAGDGDIDVRIHAAAGHLWVDWIDAEGRLAWSERDPDSGAWSAPAHEPYAWGEAGDGDAEPVARERARDRIRRHVLGAP